MLKIRLRRMGAKKAPFYRIVVSDGRSTPQGRFVDVVGTYDPANKADPLKMEVDKVETWIGKGAHPSDTVRSLLKKAKKAGAAAPETASA